MSIERFERYNGSKIYEKLSHSLSMDMNEIAFEEKFMPIQITPTFDTIIIGLNGYESSK